MDRYLYKEVGDMIYQAEVEITNSRFSVTGMIYEVCKEVDDEDVMYEIAVVNGKDCLVVGGGCIHEELLEQFPQLEPVIKLHLSDLDGKPMYFIENGMYHLKNSTKEIAMKYLRLTEVEYDGIKSRLTEMDHYSYIKYLEANGIIGRWKNESEEALNVIKSLNLVSHE